MNFAGDADYELDLDSDVEEEDIDVSSEDEIEILLHGSERQRERLMKSRSTREKRESSSEDEFEKEMSKELNSTVKLVEAHNRSFSETLPETSNGQPGSSTGSTDKGDSTAKKHKLPEYYDNIYFDSDSDGENTSEAKKAAKREVMSNDDLLYDPNMDNEDQDWVDNQRRKASGAPSGKRAKGRGGKMPSSDAVLNCPACMVTLCRDCQRHEIYKSQYRAMFVTNCKVLTDEVLRFPKGGKLKKKQKRNKENQVEQSESSASTSETQSRTNPPLNASDDDMYNPVKCEQCNTEVGVLDKEEIYHFFNVLASYS